MENALYNQSWSPLQKIAFRFSFLTLSMFVLIENNGAYPFHYQIMSYPREFLHVFIPWVGKNMLHLTYDITVFTNGSGDTTYDFVVLFTILCVSVLGTIVWSVLDRNRKNYSVLYYWLTVAVRFYVGFMLFNYGLYKVFKSQFPSPGINRLIQPYGNSSPMGLAWTFMGYSRGYNFFMGIAEVAALLLLFRRTVTIGAIITLMTTANVMAVNYFYDVPVKIVSTALVVMTIFMLIPDLKRLFKFFFTGEAVSLPAMPAPEVKRKWLCITAYGLKYVTMAYVIVMGTIGAGASEKQFGDAAPKPPLYGFYSVKSFVRNNDTVPPIITDATYWRHLAIQWSGYAQITFLNDTTQSYLSVVDTVRHTINLTQEMDFFNKSFLTYRMIDDKNMLLQGTMMDDSVAILLNRRTDKDFRLMRQGFRWINEYPFNR
ncbi:MAG: hypothetical protein WKF87_14320 [Chryseolinea sp.]